MDFRTLIFPFLFVLIAGFDVAPGGTIYVATSGNDNNPGTRAQPVASLTAARDRARALRKNRQVQGPVEIIIAPGTYPLREPLVLTPEDASLVFKGRGKTVPVISGGVELPAFEKVTDHLWKTRIPALAQYGGSVQQVFINGERAVLARTPNAEQWFKTKKVTETFVDSAKNAVQKISLTGEQWHALQPVPDRALSQVIISVHHAWDRTRKYLHARSAADSGISITGRPMKSWNKLDNASQFILENAKEFLDAPGEWWLDEDGTLFYVPRKGETIAGSKAIIPVIDHFITISGDSSRKVKDVRFERLSFQYTRYNMPSGGNEPVQAASPIPAAVMIDHAANIQWADCEIAHTGTNAIWFRAGCTDSKVSRCYFHDLGVGAVKIGEVRAPANDQAVTGNIVVDNNILRSGGHVFPTGVGVTIFHSGDNIISHNEIADFRYSGVSVGWIWGYKHSFAKRNQIIYNHIHHIGWGLLSDMGGVYTLGPSEGTVVSNNVIHDIYSYGYGGWGLYTDEGSTGVVMENNLVYRCKSSAFHQHYGKDNLIRNNIFVSQIKAQLEATRVEDHRSFSFSNNIIYLDAGTLIDKPGWGKVNFAADSNCYWDARTQGIRFGQQDLKAWQASTGKDKNSIVADPGFADIARLDFHVRNKAVIEKIHFTPFAYEKAGVYGDAAWKQRAVFNSALAAQFEKMVQERERSAELEK